MAGGTFALLFLFLHDMNGTVKEGHALPRRIVSLSPSITRQISDLGCEDRLAGVTSQHPPLARKVPVVGTMIHPAMERIISLQPDLVLLSEEDSAVQSVERLSSLGLRIRLFPRNADFSSICRNYLDLGIMLGVPERAARKIAEYRKRHGKLMVKVGRVRALFLVSVRPMIAAGDETFIGAILRDAGAVNPVRNAPSPYPIVSVEFLLTADPDIVILMEPEGPDDPGIGGLDRLRAAGAGHIYRISPDNVAFYTPADYLRALEILGTLVKRAAPR